MQRIWISRTSTVPVREQLSAQLLFAILSRRLGPGERLPSVRDLARRIDVHPNTVSAAYQDLAARGWVERRSGSGVFVRDLEHAHEGEPIDAFVHAWLAEGLSRGFSPEALCAAMDKARGELSADHERHRLLVVHPDRELAAVLAAELTDGIGREVAHATPDEARRMSDLDECLLLTTTSGGRAVAELRPDGHKLIPLKSVEEVVQGMRRPSTPILIGVVSRCGAVLDWASRLIPVLGLDGSDVIRRNPTDSDWRRGLAGCDIVAADVLAARELPRGTHAVLLRLIPESFLDEVRRLACPDLDGVHRARVE
jgi:DNA-binding transcriptional regulator YhcF (GntR family)